jgi:beta-lactamase superfamily II metal-dependent hydrolase
MAKRPTPSARAPRATPPEAPRRRPSRSTTADPGAAPQNAATGVRVRMYRVGFGDFFLVSVPSPNASKHILIDCGVHAKDLNTIGDAVAQMEKDCGGKLALIIMTHRHADHISGFARCAGVFKRISVETVWMPWFENRSNSSAMKFQANLTAMAGRLQMALAARPDPQSERLRAMAENITGAGGSNEKALDVLQSGFANSPTHQYYKAGDEAVLPQGLVEAGVSAQILGPPIDETLIAQMTNRSEQYLSSALEPDQKAGPPFNPAFRARPEDYPPSAFKYVDAAALKKMVDGAQPNMLEALAATADNNLNNQSLVVLFTVGGKHLLFAGDAQWGNWENFLYGGKVATGSAGEIKPEARAILEKIDFYKVGHHGSANATPKDAVAAMRVGCVGMCSTQVGAYNEVPREPLLSALSTRMNGQLARSDQVAAGDAEANDEAGPLASLFRAPVGKLFIDYVF